MADDSSLPPEVRSAWGLTPPSRRGSRPELSLTRIVETALQLADASGLQAISMARVASELGFTTMSLYRHVGSKDELLVHVQDAALGSPSVQLSDGLAWRAGLAVWTRELLEAYLRHPSVLDIPISGPPLMPRNLEWMDWALRIMTEVPLSGAEKLSTLLLLSGYARNEATTATSLQRAEAQRRRDVVEDLDYEGALLHLVDADHLPALHALVAEGKLFEPGPQTDADDVDALFRDYGLDRILDGIESFVDRRDA